MAADNKTEKATPKREKESRKKGQVAKSPEVASTAILLAGLTGLVALGPRMFDQLKEIMARGIGQAADPSLVSGAGLGQVGLWAMLAVAAVIAPILLITGVAAFAANAVQVKFLVAPQALKPQMKRISPLAGFKRIFGPNALFEGSKTVTKTAVIGLITFLAVWPKLKELGGLVGLPPSQLLSHLVSIIMGIAWRTAAAMLVIAVVDYLWQRRKHDKSLRMSMDEVKKESRESDLPPEVRGQLRRRQMERARTRMLAAVPTADVVIANPTHFAVALRYDGSLPAPQVVAKGVDHLAAQIRHAAEENDVPVIENPPLARALYKEVELDAVIPEAFFAAVAEVLAFVFRTARRRGPQASAG